MIRRISILLLLFVATIGNSFSIDKSLIKGRFSNSGNYKLIYIYKFFGSELIKIDSSKLNKGSFKFNNQFSRGFYKIGFSQNKAIVFVIGNEKEIQITADCNNFPGSSKISGSRENDLYIQFGNQNSLFGNSVKLLSQQTAQLDNLRKTDTTRYKEILFSLRHQEDSIMKNQNQFFLKMSTENEGTFMAKFAKMFVLTDTTTAINYFTNQEFTDIEYTSGEMLVGKINSFFTNFVEKVPDKFTEAASYLLSKPAIGSPTKELFYKSIINLFIEIKLETASKFRKEMAKEFAGNNEIKKYLSSLPTLGVEVGDEAPEIFLPDTMNNFVKLSSLKGSIVLLDFWASWCGPCRKENPNVVKLYEKYKSKGLIILSISLDETKQNWLNAIKKDKLTWLHVSDLRGWRSAAAASYGVQSIPQTFIVGKDGVIIAKNLRGQSLESFIEQQFSK